MKIQHNILFFLFALAVFSCRKEKFTIENLNGNKITALGHAGMGIGYTYPMNSAEAILCCLNLGMDGSEFDVQLTNDSVLVAFHDKNLAGNTTLSSIINELNWSDVKNARYTQVPYSDYSLVSLDQLFSGIPNLLQYTFTFDCKLYSIKDMQQFKASYTNAVINIIEKYNLQNNVCIESQDEGFLHAFKLRKDYRFFLYPENFEDGMYYVTSWGLCGLTMSTHNISKEQIKIAHDNNLMVAIWDIHSDNENKAAIRKNPDFIQTDKVKNLVKLLK